jgi:hypothetical protein
MLAQTSLSSTPQFVQINSTHSDAFDEIIDALISALTSYDEIRDSVGRSHDQLENNILCNKKDWRYVKQLLKQRQDLGSYNLLSNSILEALEEGDTNAKIWTAQPSSTVQSSLAGPGVEHLQLKARQTEHLIKRYHRIPKLDFDIHYETDQLAETHENDSAPSPDF